MKFRYQGIAKDGQPQKGLVEALNKRSALELLINNELRITKLEEVKTNSVTEGIMSLWVGVSAKDFMMFSRQLAVMIEAKVSLIMALQAIANQSNNPFFAMKIRSIIADIDGGSSFSEALSKHRDVFSKLYINMVRAGEASGNLHKTLNDLADNIESNYDLTSKLRGAMYYPAFILFAMVAVGFVVLTFVLPPLMSVLKDSDVQLPLQTRILMGISTFLRNYWWAAILGFLGAGFSLAYYLKSEAGQKELSQFVLKIPIMSKIFNNIYLARFAENLSTLVKSGLPITTALLITGDVIGNEVYRQIIQEAANEIKKGGSMADTFKRYELMPAMMVQMIHVGESTGRIDYTLEKVKDFFKKEADQMVKNFSVLIEPVIMVILAIGVGILVSAVLLPIYQLASAIK